MTQQRFEHDWPPTMHARRGRRRQPLPLEGEVLGPEELEPKTRIHRVEIAVHHHRQRHSAPSPWLIALLVIAALMWWAPLGTVILIVIVAMGIMAHPAIGIALAASVALFVGITIYQRRRGRAF